MSSLRSAPARDTESAASILREDGVVRLDEVWTRDTLIAARDMVFAGHPEFADPGKLTDVLRNGEGRFIAPVTLGPGLLDLGLLDNAAVEALLESALGPAWVHEAFGMMMAHSGCPDQHVHRDTDPLFPETGVDPLLPPTVLTIAIPLVEIGEANGRTAFYPGSHRTGSRDGISPASIDVRLGSALVWDFRTIHYGCANTSNEDRPLLYFTSCRPFWFDHKNFRTGNRRLIAEAEVLDSLGPRFVRTMLA